MSFLGLLVNLVDGERPTIARTRGVEAKMYTATVSDLICSIQYRQGGALGSGGYGSLGATEHGYEVYEGWWGIFNHGEDIQKDDRLTDESGRVFIVKSDPLDMTGRGHHQECILAIVEE